MRTHRILAASLIGLGMTSPVLAEAESDEPIIIVQNNWSSQLVMSNVVGQVLESEGYTVEYVPSDSQLQLTAITNGDMTFQIEAWEGSMKAAFEKAVEEGMVDAGTHDAVTREEWWIPDYVLEKCPDAATWEGLNACANIFTTAETAPKGRFVGPPADWGKNYAARIDALGMDFVAINVGQAATLWAELQSAYDRKEPIVLFNWTPNFVESKFEGRFVDFPEPEPACFDDPSWGPNPDATGDCGAPRAAWLKKAAWKGMADEWPGAWAIVQKINLTNKQLANASKMVDDEGMSPEDAATKWIEDNRDVVDSWLN
ncbi:ABC transporter substrate-binding protein [Aurantimonas sp. C2-6-R+9]|uniref:ABC transporter substrate-binding protein n=1 Tax=unclassified Aurantimonas TaxID=2638230 RepID=UPI002E183E04|nr:MULTISPECIES: ABC transporter substrate-binding protein [unclassified Aurantimonas]MEC5291140.1 ABC transporter substrate-binding protein [Aurantimonas sp. C2-3-R2]MEC5381467.1 ABC transporter substrate-binding protein [Aurantimonas sp. C2-6-R+9]MEC5411898.1 ABC transporter substrate-binding protein [Aurantimonas sp. C2-4-R8]